MSGIVDQPDEQPNTVTTILTDVVPEYDFGNVLAAQMLIRNNRSPLGACIFAKRWAQKKSANSKLDRNPTPYYASRILPISIEQAREIETLWNTSGGYYDVCPATEHELRSLELVDQLPDIQRLFTTGILLMAGRERDFMQEQGNG